MLSGIIGPEAVARRILEKVAVATLAEDRKAALVELKEKADSEPAAVGKIAICELCRLLPGFREDVDMLRPALETLLACLSPEVSVVGAEAAKEAAAANVALFTQDAISLVLEILEDDSWSTRLAILKIVGAIQVLRPGPLQMAILQSPQGLARLMDVLLVDNEIVRNEVLLVLVNLTRGNQELNKIMAFEGAFDTLLGVIRDEDNGSVIASDCCAIVANLLHNNPSNASLFRELGSLGNFLLPLLQKGYASEVASEGSGLLMQTLHMVRDLIAASGPDPSAALDQLGKPASVMGVVAEASVHAAVSPPCKAAALRVMGQIIRRHAVNQLALSQLRSAQTGTSVLSLVLSNALGQLPNADAEVQAAAVQVFRCYLSGNEDGQQHLAAQLMPQPSVDEDDQNALPEVTMGRTIVAVLANVSAAPLAAVWGATAVLCSVLWRNSVCQEIAVATPVQLPTSEAPPEMLLSVLLAATSGLEPNGCDNHATAVTACVLKALCLWSHECSRACDAILKQPSTVVWLVGLVAQGGQGSTDSGGRGMGGGGGGGAMVHVRGAAALLLCSCMQSLSDHELRTSVLRVLESRAGIDVFQRALSLFGASEAMVAAKRREDAVWGPAKLTADEAVIGYPLYDSEFAALAVSIENKFQKTLLSLMGGVGGSGSASRGGGNGGDAALITERDALKEQVAELQAQLALASEEVGKGGGNADRRCEELEEALGNREAVVKQLNQELADVKAQLGGLEMSNKILEQELGDKTSACTSLQADMTDLRAKLATSQSKDSSGGGLGDDSSGVGQLSAAETGQDWEEMLARERRSLAMEKERTAALEEEVRLMRVTIEEMREQSSVMSGDGEASEANLQQLLNAAQV